MILKQLSKKFYINLLILFSIFLIDRFSKLYVIYLSQRNYNPEIFTSKFLDINLVWNEGIAFGLFSFNEKFLYNIFTVIISIIIFIILVMVIKNKGFKQYSLILIFGGALGNFYDRIFYKTVPDFIDFHIGQFHWFIFNAADIFITTGVIFMILFELTDKN